MELGNDSSRKIWPKVSPLSDAVKWWLSGIIFIDRSHSWGSSGSSVHLCGFSKVATSGQPFNSGPKGMTSNRDPGGISGTLSSFRSHTTPLLHNLIFNFFFFYNVFIYFLAALGLHCFAWAFSSCSKQGCFSLLWSTGCRSVSFSSFGLRALERTFSSCVWV